MLKYNRFPLFIVGLFVVLLVIKEFGSYAQIQIKMGSAVFSLTNAAQDVGAIDVYIDHKLVKAALQKTDPAFFMQLTPGNHLIDVVPAGENITLIKTTELAFKANHTYQLTLAGREADWSVALGVADETAK